MMSVLFQSKKQFFPLFVVFVALCLLLLAGCQRLTAKFIGVQAITAECLKEAASDQQDVLILDTRGEAAYKVNRIPGAIHVAIEEIEGYLDRKKVPWNYTIVTVCAVGWKSQASAASVMAMGYPKVYSLIGGMERWKERGYPVCSSSDPLQKEAFEPPVVEISVLSQLVMTVAAFLVKPAYIILSFLIIVMLWGQKSKDLAIIRNAVVVFFIGENACTLNYIIAGNGSILLEFAHGLGMAGSYFLLAWGLFLFFDGRIFHYLDSGRPCVFQRHCKGCWKNEDVTCGFHRLALFLVPALAFVTLIPVTMPLRPFRIVMPVFLSDVLWFKDFWNLFVQFRIYPMLGAIGFLISFLWLWKGKGGLSKAQLPFFAAVGFASYSFFRFGLLLTFKENQAWADWWEEATEFIMIAAVLFFLEIFKTQLALKTPWPLNRYGPFKIGEK